jgi:hypothetical protein
MGVFKSMRELKQQAKQIEPSMPPLADRMAGALVAFPGAADWMASQRADGTPGAAFPRAFAGAGTVDSGHVMEPWRPWLRPSSRDVLRSTRSQICWQARWRPSSGCYDRQGTGRGACAGGRWCRGGRDPHGGPGRRRRGGHPRPGRPARDGHGGAVAVPQPVHRVAVALAIAEHVAVPQPFAIPQHVAFPQPLTVTEQVAFT